MKNGFKTFKMSITAFLFLSITLLSIPLATFSANNSLDNSLSYIAGFQDQSTGGIKEEYIDEPQALETDWAIMAFSASGYDPATVGTPKNMIDFTKSASCSLTTLTDIERRILSLEPAGIDTHNLSGCNLPQKIIAEIQESGQIGESLTSTVFGSLALSASGEIIPSATIDYIENSQSKDGGWDSGWGTESNFTSQTIMALKSSGQSFDSAIIDKSKEYLKSLQTDTGGIKYDSNEWSTEPDAFSDSYALQAIYSLGENPRDDYWLNNGNSIIDDLNNLRNSDGSYQFSRTYGNMSPVWTTSIALIANNQKYLPVFGNNLKPWGETVTPSPTPNVSPSIVVSPTLTATATTTVVPISTSTASQAPAQTASPSKIPQKTVAVKIQPTLSVSPTPCQSLTKVTPTTQPTVLAATANQVKSQWRWILTLAIFSILTGVFVAFLEQKYVKKY